MPSVTVSVDSDGTWDCQVHLECFVEAVGRLGGTHFEEEVAALTEGADMEAVAIILSEPGLEEEQFDGTGRTVGVR